MSGWKAWSYPDCPWVFEDASHPVREVLLGFFGFRFVFTSSWENSRHFETPPVISRKSTSERRGQEIRCWLPFTNRIWVVLRSLINPIRSTIQIWVVILPVASHAGVFRRVRFLCGEAWKTSSPKNACVVGYPTGVAKCGLLSRASLSAARSLSHGENFIKNL